MSTHYTLRRSSGPRQERRAFLVQTGGAILCGLSAHVSVPQSLDPARAQSGAPSDERAHGGAGGLRLFLCGDVMAGRGIDQVMSHPGDPRLYEDYVKSAAVYVEIAERANGPIPRGVAPQYVWGDALAVLERARPDVRIVNLETAVTTADDPWPGKGINYRMHPANVAFLTAAGIDCCVLANNHVLDWGYDGLRETLGSLRAIRVRTAGAGDDETESEAPAVIDLPERGRLLVFAFGSPSSGVPRRWAAQGRRPGIAVLDESAPDSVARIARRVAAVRRPGDIVIASLHWGGNWGYAVSEAQRTTARRLIDAAQVDVVHGHSSHHPRPVEVYRDKLILYGCGDFLNDYEGIGGYEGYRPELAFMYMPELDPASGRLQRLLLVPMRIRGFRVNRASREEAEWLMQTMNREGQAFGTRFEPTAEGEIDLRWGAAAAIARLE